MKMVDAMKDTIDVFLAKCLEKNASIKEAHRNIFNISDKLYEATGNMVIKEEAFKHSTTFKKCTSAPSQPLVVLIPAGRGIFEKHMETCLSILDASSEEPELAVSGLISIFATRGFSVVCSPEFCNNFARNGKQLQIIYVDGPDILRHFDCANPILRQRLIDIWEVEKWPDTLNTPTICIPVKKSPSLLPAPHSLKDPRAYWIYLGVFLSSMTKKLTNKNFSLWKASRVKAFSGTFGFTQYNPCGIDTKVFPSLVTCSRIKKEMTLLWSIRKDIFLFLLKCTGVCSNWSNLCSLVCMYAKGMDMTNFILIDKYIMHMYPFLVNLPCLQASLSDLFSDYENLENMNIDSSLWPYIKIIHEDCDFLHRNRHTMLTTIAVDIGKGFEPSLEHYVVHQDTTSDISNSLAEVYRAIKDQRARTFNSILEYLRS